MLLYFVYIVSPSLRIKDKKKKGKSIKSHLGKKPSELLLLGGSLYVLVNKALFFPGLRSLEKKKTSLHKFGVSKAAVEESQSLLFAACRVPCRSSSVLPVGAPAAELPSAFTCDSHHFRLFHLVTSHLWTGVFNRMTVSHWRGKALVNKRRMRKSIIKANTTSHAH